MERDLPRHDLHPYGDYSPDLLERSSGGGHRSRSGSSHGDHHAHHQHPSNKRRREDDGNTRAADNSSKPRRERSANACKRCKAKKLKCLLAEDGSKTCLACVKAVSQCVFEDANLKQAQLKDYLHALESRVVVLEKALYDLDPRHPEIADQLIGPGAAGEEGHSPMVGTTAFSKRLPSSTREDNGDANANTRRIIMGSVHQERRHFRPIDMAALIQPLSPTTHTRGVNARPALPAPPVADKIITTAYHHVHSRYPFMDWERLRSWEQRRDEVCFAPTTASATHTDDQIGAFFLWLTYAVGAELAPDPTLESPKTYLDQAMRYLDFVLQPHDMTTARAMLFLLFFSFRSSDGPPLWFLSGFVTRLCLELYLHRENHAHTPFEAEDRKRVFWSAYSFDRLLSLASGRPFCIADADIEISLPVDIDLADKDPTRIALLQVSQSTMSPPYTVTGELTTMSSAIHTIRHYRIRSRIYTLYAVRAERPSPDVIRTILNDLQEWRDAIPRHATPSIPVQAEDKFDMVYFQTVLFALRQEVAQCDPSDPLLALCAMSAAESCERGRKVYQNPKAKNTICSLCFLFVSGVTLLHCLLVNPNVIPTRTSSRALRSCSSTLAIYAQLFPDAAIPFRDLFELFSDEVMAENSPSEAGDGIIAGIPTADILKQVMLGEFSQLGAVYESLNNIEQRGSNSITTPATNPSVPLFNLLVPPVASGTTSTDAFAPQQDLTTIPPSTGVSQLNFDLGNLTRYGGDLTSFLDISLDAPIDAWLGNWDQGI